MNIVVFYNKKKKYVQEVLEKLRKWADEKGYTLYEEEKEHLEDCDLAIAAGGDGTFLRAASVIYTYGIPILGINLGAMGFLTEVRREEVDKVLEELSLGNYEIRERMVLQISHAERVDYALNDAVITMGENRMIGLEIMIDDNFVTELWGDGLIISTPTGSTAYSLASGGPILTPNTPGIIITPISPHTLSFRPIVLDDKSRISIQIKDNAQLILDGQRQRNLITEDIVRIQGADRPLKIVKVDQKDFFQILREKLHWGNR
ncbi:NAD(+)/NADH kinase [candidate division WOR-3 bacterium]|nr:NAD(+)/NADH kinase [candidate division WOR-3 bacterium]MCK4529184.1 NAD(+)/NADH kinase [candidate division WOR-3 bacterium]